MARERKKKLTARRKEETQSIDNTIKAINTLRSLTEGKFMGSGVIITMTDLSGNVMCDAMVDGAYFDAVKDSVNNSLTKTLELKAANLRGKLKECEKIFNTSSNGQAN